MPLSPRAKKTWGILLPILLVLVLVWIARARFASESAIGIYLTKGGRSLLVIERGWLHTLRVSEGFFPSLVQLYGIWPEPGIRADVAKGHLQIHQREAYMLGVPPRPGKCFLNLRLAPSSETPGDWDLVSGRFSAHDSRLFNVTLPTRGLTGGWLDRLIGDFERFAVVFAERFRPQIQMEMSVGDPPAKSFLHRIDDPRLIPYFKSRQVGKLPEEIRNTFWEIFAEHPEDPYLAAHAIDVAAHSGDVEKGLDLERKWRFPLSQSPDLLLRKTAKDASKSLAKARGLPYGKDLREVLASLTDERANLSELMTRIQGILNYPFLLTSIWPVVEPVGDGLIELCKTPDFLQFQVDARLANAVAKLKLFEGKREESLELLGGLYRLGQMMTADGALIQRLIGIAIQNTDTEAMGLFVLNACETPEEFARCWEIRDRLHRVPGQETGESLLDGEWMVPVSLMKKTSGRGSSAYDIGEILTRFRVSEIHFQLVRSAAAAKAQSLLSREFPRSAEYFAPYLPGGPPKDAFSDGPLRFTDPSEEPYTIYSVGPDEKDDGGTIDYSPTNGTRSVGDIVIRIPREREFPFPEEDVRAKDADDLLRQFPNGLPIDVFAGFGKDTALSIVDSTGDSPLRIFSFGPVGDWESWTANLDTYEIPGLRRIDLRGTDRTKHPAIQKVYTPVEPTENAETWTLGPAYDPTNGFRSQGQIILEIPK